MKNILSFIPQIIQLIPLIVSGIETLTKGNKPEELTPQEWNKTRQDAALNSLGAMITSLEILYGKELMNVPEFQVLVRKLIDDYIACENFAREWKKNLNGPVQ